MELLRGAKQQTCGRVALIAQELLIGLGKQNKKRALMVRTESYCPVHCILEEDALEHNIAFIELSIVILSTGKHIVVERRECRMTRNPGPCTSAGSGLHYSILLLEVLTILLPTVLTMPDQLFLPLAWLNESRSRVTIENL